MNDSLELRDLARGIRRRWWLPLLLAVIGAGVGLTTAFNVAPIHRAQATVLVGPTNGAVTHSATVRTSEDLAVFYADLARRQLVLDPVVQEEGLTGRWSDLRNRVSAVVPKENPRLVTVTVMEDTQSAADRIANALVQSLVSLSPPLAGGNSQAFINEQVDNLKGTIEGAQSDISSLKAQEAGATPERRQELQQQVLATESRLAEWRHTYVELIGAEPTSDAGGLQVLDEASAVTDQGRAGPTRQALLGVLIGAVLGLLGAALLHRRDRRRDIDASLRRLEAAATTADESARTRTSPEHADRPETGAAASRGYRGVSLRDRPHAGTTTEDAHSVLSRGLKGERDS